MRVMPWTRVSIPVRLLISYLLVVALGAVPIGLYLWQETFQQLTLDRARTLASDAGRLQQLMIPKPLPERLQLAQQYAQLTDDRVTYLDASGVVLYDSEANVTSMENHLLRPEVQVALGKLPPEGGGVAFVQPGVGAATRVSTTTRQESLYVAVLVPAGGSGAAEILRLAQRMESIRTITNNSLDFARNSQAVAVSAAILFSLLAAVLFSRPLQRVVEAAQAMSQGELAVKLNNRNNDEVGDAARALEQLAQAMRRRLAGSRSGEAMLAQLVEALDIPLVVLEQDGELVAINGEGRQLLHLGALELGGKTVLVHEPAFVEAMRIAEQEGEPERLSLPLPDQPGRSVSGVLHMLKRPGQAPLCAVLGEGWGTQRGFLAPDPRSVRPVEVQELLRSIHRRVSTLMGLTGTQLKLPDELPDVKVADVEGRLLWGTMLLLVECAGLEHVERLVPRVKVQPTFVIVELPDVEAAPGALNVLRALWEPLGGEALQSDRNVILRWPRA